jgi:predicted PurR-regulated permease PerM
MDVEKRSTDPRHSRREYLWRVTAALALVVTAVVAWLAIDILLLIFGGILLAIFLRALSDPLARHTPLSETVALALTILFIVGLSVAGFVVVAPELAEQIGELGDAIPAAVNEVQGWLQHLGLENQFEEGGDGGAILEAVTGFLGGAMQWLGYFLTFLFVGLFVAFRPGIYVDGFVALIPIEQREEGRDLLKSLATTLRWWLIGRALAMVMVGVSTTIVLMILGLPLAGLLGVIAGLLTFVPYIGPFVAGFPIALVALMEGPADAALAVGLYSGVQLVEGYILDPLIQQKMVYLPPAITVAAQMMMALLLGPLGIALATPLSAVALVLVQKTYVDKRP